MQSKWTADKTVNRARIINKAFAGEGPGLSIICGTSKQQATVQASQPRAYGCGFPCDIMIAATPAQIAIPKAVVYKGNHIWRYGHIRRFSFVRFLSAFDIVAAYYFC
jgi:hypothetical protein